MRPFLASFLASALCISTALAHARPPRYDEHEPVPTGYRVEERPRTSMAVTGAVFAGLGATLLAFGVYELASGDKTESYPPVSTVALLTGGALAAIGTPLLVVGLTTKKKVLVPGSYALTPVVSPSFGGLAVAATF